MNCGIRIGELIDLRVKDITFEGCRKGKILVRNGKGNQSRKITLTDKITDKVEDYKRRNKLSSEALLFTNRDGKPYSDENSLN